MSAGCAAGSSQTRNSTLPLGPTSGLFEQPARAKAFSLCKVQHLAQDLLVDLRRADHSTTAGNVLPPRLELRLDERHNAGIRLPLFALRGRRQPLLHDRQQDTQRYE